MVSYYYLGLLQIQYAFKSGLFDSFLELIMLTRSLN